ncbi:MAG: ABC transporter permease [Ignavibacteriae bacterium]|nr:ABC transporter permease [Ignavibacteriota bacterium]
MSFPLFIALRYLRSSRNRGFTSFITGIAIVGVMLGVAALIVTLSILDGFEKTITESLISFTSHMQVVAFQGHLLKNPENAMQKIKSRFPEVREIAPFVSREAMIRSEVDNEGVLIKGIDPTNDLSPIRHRLVAGAYDLSERIDGLQGIIIGKRLAEKLETKQGDKLLVFALQGTSLSLGQTRIIQFEVRGIYETGMAEFDESYVYVNIKSAQRLFQAGQSVSGFDVLVTDLSKLEELTRAIPEYMEYPYFARSMQQMHRNLFTWVELQKKPVPIILGLIVIVATVNIIGTLLMMVMEKTKEIGVLRTLGARKAVINRIFLLQGLLIGIVGTVLGNAFAYLLCWLELQYQFFSLPSDIYYMTHAPIELSVWNFLLVSSIALAMCLISSFLPSRIASKLDPMVTLRFA